MGATHRGDESYRVAAVILIGTGAHGMDILSTLDDRQWGTSEHHEADDIDEGTTYILGINDPQLRDKVRAEMGWDDEAWIHPNAYIGRDCRWRKGTHINYGVSMIRTTIGHHTTISPGVTICGDVTIGDRVLIGAGATICDRVTIGDDVTIGAGAVILPESVIPNGVTASGVPAKW